MSMRHNNENTDALLATILIISAVLVTVQLVLVLV